MAGAVTSVETFQFTLGSGTGSDTATLGESQDIDYCVPFLTRRVTSGSKYEIETVQTAAYFTSTDTLNVQRDDSSGVALAVEVGVVEFDSTLCNVYSGQNLIMTSSSGGDTASAALPSSVNTSKAFLVFYAYENSGTGVQYPSHLIRGRITDSAGDPGGTHVYFDRAEFDGTADVFWFVVECIGTEFSVQPTTVSLTGSDTQSTDTVDVDASKTLLLGSWASYTIWDEYNNYNTVDVTFTDTTVTVQRAAANGNLDWSGFAIEFADGTSVQHGTWNESTADGDESVTLTTPVSLTRSVAVITGNMGGTATGSFPGTSNTDVLDPHVQLTLEDSDTGGDFDTIRLRHFTTGGEADNDVSWSVVEFGTGAGIPPRRVMVIS